MQVAVTATIKSLTIAATVAAATLSAVTVTVAVAGTGAGTATATVAATTTGTICSGGGAAIVRKANVHSVAATGRDWRGHTRGDSER